LPRPLDFACTTWKVGMPMEAQVLLQYVVDGAVDACGIAVVELLSQQPQAWRGVPDVCTKLHIRPECGSETVDQLVSVGAVSARFSGGERQVRLAGGEPGGQPVTAWIDPWLLRPKSIRMPEGWTGRPSEAGRSESQPRGEVLPAGPSRPTDVLRAAADALGGGRAAQRTRRGEPVTPAASEDPGSVAPANGSPQSPDSGREQQSASPANDWSHESRNPLGAKGERPPFAGARAEARSSGRPDEEDLKTSSGFFRKGEPEGERLAGVQGKRAEWLLRQRISQEAIARTGASDEQILRALHLYFSDPRLARGEINCAPHLLRSKIEIVTAHDAADADAAEISASVATEVAEREQAMLDEHARRHTGEPASCLLQQLRDLAAGFASNHSEDCLCELAARHGGPEETDPASTAEIRAQIREMLRRAG